MSYLSSDARLALAALRAGAHEIRSAAAASRALVQRSRETLNVGADATSRDDMRRELAIAGPELVDQVQSDAALREENLELKRKLAAAEERLRTGEARLELLEGSLTQAVWETDAAGVVVADSPSWRAYTGQTLEEWLGYGWLDAIHPDDRAYAERQWRQAVASAGVVDAEFRLRAPDGGWRWTNVRAVPLRDERGDISQWVGVNIDIHARKRAEVAVVGSEGKYRTLFEAIDVGFAIFEMIYNDSGEAVDFRYVETNPAFERQAGRRPRPGQTMRELFPEAEDMWLADYAEVARTGRSKRFVDSVEGLDRWFDVYVFPAKGQPGLLAALFRDVTDSKQAEEALRRSEERHAFLVRFSDAVRGLTDPAAVATVACRMLLEEMDIDRAHWAEIDWTTEEFVTVGSIHSPGVVRIEGRFPLAAWEPYSASHREGRSVVVDDTQTDPRADSAMRAAAARMNIGADLAAPVLVGGRLAGVLAVKRRQPRHWTSEEIALVESIAARCWDEVERARSEEALRKSEEKYRTLFDSIDEGFTVVELVRDSEGKPFDLIYREFNGAFERLSGFTRAVLNKGVREVLPSFNPDWFVQYARILDTGEPERSEEYLPDLGIWNRRFMSRIGGPGSPFCAVIFDDITERKRAEIALRESEERQAFLLRLTDAIRSVQSEEEVVVRGLRMLADELALDRCYATRLFPEEDRTEVIHEVRGAGLPPMPKTLRNSDFPEAFKQTFDRTLVFEDVANDPALTDADSNALAAMGFGALLSRPLRKDGSPIFAIGAVSADPRRWTPNEIGLVEEVTERTWEATERVRNQAALRESEERFRQFANASAAGLWIRETKNREMEFTSPAMGIIYGVEPEALLGDVKEWARLIVPEDRGTALEHLGAATRGDSPVHEFRIQRPSDGTFRWVRDTAFALQDNGHVARIGGIAEDITETRQLAEHQGVLLSELQHRVRNIMGVIRSIANRTAGGAKGAEEYRQLLEGRLLALSRVQALLTQQGNSGGSLRDLVYQELAARAHRGNEFELIGPDVMLSPKAVEVLTLAFHELATNALKYGALSTAEGRVNVSWAPFEKRGATWLAIDWVEEGAPSRELSGRVGFGSELIEGRIPYELGGIGKLVIEVGGARCHMEFPLKDAESILETDAPRPTMVFGGSLDMTGAPDLTGRKVLVVEDDYYLARDTAAALAGAGAAVLGPCSNERATLALLEDQTPTHAILDLNLGGGGPNFGIANELQRRGVPFVFLTGYDPDVIPDELASVPRLQKPVQFRAIVETLANI